MMCRGNTAAKLRCVAASCCKNLTCAEIGRIPSVRQRLRRESATQLPDFADCRLIRFVPEPRIEKCELCRRIDDMQVRG